MSGAEEQADRELQARPFGARGAVWKLEDAKARFSEVVRLARLRGFALLWRYFGAAGCR
jgi:hypothetical protein